MICNVEFVLNEPRVTTLERAGVTSIRSLYQVLAALELRAVIKLEPLPAQERPHKEIP
jgi:hypothetical protein